MIFVGLMGGIINISLKLIYQGSSYVNVAYIIVSSEKIP
jgi:hypothetical protein